MLSAPKKRIKGGEYEFEWVILSFCLDEQISKSLVSIGFRVRLSTEENTGKVYTLIDWMDDSNQRWLGVKKVFKDSESIKIIEEPLR